MTKNLAFSLMRHNVRVNQVNPGWMDTEAEDAVQRRFHGATDGWLERAEAGQPMGRLIKPHEVAKVVLLPVRRVGDDDRHHHRLRPIRPRRRRRAQAVSPGDPTMTVRIGVLGVGRIGKMHAELIARQVPGAVVAMVHDINGEAAAAVGATNSACRTPPTRRACSASATSTPWRSAPAPTPTCRC